MKVLVTYHSETGNTEKLAKAIYEGIEQAEKDLLPVKEVKSVDGYDLIFCGFPVQSHSVPGRAETFIKGLPEGKRLALFATHGSLRGGEKAVTAFHYSLSLRSRDTILGTFGCRGKVKSSMIETLLKKPEHRAWALEARSAAGHPDSADLEDSREWAGWMIRKARSQ